MKSFGKTHAAQRGAAMLIALLVLSLVAALAAGMQWRQWRMLQQESALRAQLQVRWILLGALDWARLILREDARAAGNEGLIDHLGEPWAVPLQETKLASFLSAQALSDASVDAAYLAGQMQDAQGKINLTNLISTQPGTDALAVATQSSLSRLYDILSLPQEELQYWLPRWRGLGDATLRDLRPVHVEQLVWLGASPASVAQLKKYVVILPQRTPINLNTASAEVLMATIPAPAGVEPESWLGIDRATAQQLVAGRALSPLKNLSQASQLMGLGTPLLDAQFSIYSGYFEVWGRLRMGDWVILEESLVRRENLNVTTVWRRRR